jgi:DNA-binding transcriptional ArsR family regulator
MTAIPQGTTARALLAVARLAHRTGTLMPQQTRIAAHIGRTPCSVYAAWKKLQDEGKVRAKVEFVGQYRRVRIEEVRG